MDRVEGWDGHVLWLKITQDEAKRNYERDQILESISVSRKYVVESKSVVYNTFNVQEIIKHIFWKGIRTWNNVPNLNCLLFYNL